jgi:aminodeoxyfutalosine synthase
MKTDLHISDPRLKPVADKVLAGQRLDAADGLLLYQTSDLLTVGWLANHVREQRHGDICYFNVNRHINPTNICGAHCKLCAFGRDKNSPGAYEFSLEEIWQRAQEGVDEGATEFHIVGGLHPDLSFSYYLDLIRGLKQRFPQVHLKAFTMVEVGYYARISKLSIRGNFCSQGAQNHLRSQSQRPDVVKHRPPGSRNWPAIECHDALRAD